MSQQSLNPACFGNRQPSADGSFVDIEGLGYKDFWPSLLMQRHRPKPTPLTDFPNNMMLSHFLMLKKVAQIAQLSVSDINKRLAPLVFGHSRFQITARHVVEYRPLVELIESQTVLNLNQAKAWRFRLEVF
jgi:hypothetical protein